MILKYIEYIKKNIDILSKNIKNDILFLDNLNKLNIIQNGGMPKDNIKPREEEEVDKYNIIFSINIIREIRSLIFVYKNIIEAEYNENLKDFLLNKKLIKNVFININLNVNTNINYNKLNKDHFLKNLNLLNFLNINEYNELIDNNDILQKDYIFTYTFKKNTYYKYVMIKEIDYKFNININQGLNFSDIYKYILIKYSNLFNDSKNINIEKENFHIVAIDLINGSKNVLIEYIQSKKDSVNAIIQKQYIRDLNAYKKYINNVENNDINDYLYKFLCSNKNIDNQKINNDLNSNNDIYDKISTFNFYDNVNNNIINLLYDKLKDDFNYLLFAIAYVFEKKLYDIFYDKIKYIIDLYDDDNIYNYTYNSFDDFNINSFFKLLLIKYSMNVNLDENKFINEMKNSIDFMINYNNMKNTKDLEEFINVFPTNYDINNNNFKNILKNFKKNIN